MPGSRGKGLPWHGDPVGAGGAVPHPRTAGLWGLSPSPSASGCQWGPAGPGGSHPQRPPRRTPGVTVGPRCHWAAPHEEHNFRNSSEMQRLLFCQARGGGRLRAQPCPWLGDTRVARLGWPCPSTGVHHLLVPPRVAFLPASPPFRHSSGPPFTPTQEKVWWHGRVPSSVPITCPLCVFSLWLRWSGWSLLLRPTALPGKGCVLPGRCVIVALLEEMRSVPSGDSPAQGWE